MTDNWYLYVNKETMAVCRVSPTLEPDDGCHLVRIDSELGISFIEKPHTINDYVAYHDGAVTHFVKKNETSQVLIPYFYSPVMITEDVENPDVIVYLIDDEIRVALRPELVNYAMSMYANIPPEKQTVEFYISAKNDPNQLLDVVAVDMATLIKGRVSMSVLDYDPKDISIFTHKVFDSYGLHVIS